jgi:hypothetical protein
MRACWNLTCWRYATAVLTRAMKSSISVGCSRSADIRRRIIAVFSGASSGSLAAPKSVS